MRVLSTKSITDGLLILHPILGRMTSFKIVDEISSNVVAIREWFSFCLPADDNRCFPFA